MLTITLNGAKILGVADRKGSIELGKGANIVISEGDIPDMRTSIVTDAFIQGRRIDQNDKHKQLNERYNQKHNIKKPFYCQQMLVCLWLLYLQNKKSPD